MYTTGTFFLMYQDVDCVGKFEGPFNVEELKERYNELKDTCGCMAVRTERAFDLEKFFSVQEIWINDVS